MEIGAPSIPSYPIQRPTAGGVCNARTNHVPVGATAVELDAVIPTSEREARDRATGTGRARGS